MGEKGFEAKLGKGTQSKMGYTSQEVVGTQA
jgi:hypothetical protein